MLSDFHRVMLYMTLMVRHHGLADRPLISVYGNSLSDAVQYTLYKCIWCNVLVRNHTLFYCIRKLSSFFTVGIIIIIIIITWSVLRQVLIHFQMNSPESAI